LPRRYEQCAHREPFMRQPLFMYICILGTVIVVNSCTNSTEPRLYPVSLVSNPSFEISGNPTLDGWKILDSTSVRLVEDTPSAGGRWSLRLEASAFPGSAAYTKVPASQGRHRYRSSFWCKRAGVTLGSAGIFFLPHDTSSMLLNFLPVHDTVWTFHSFLDTVNANAGDSLRIILVGGTNDDGVGRTFFDLCKLEGLD
jgi:hypothetical protein